MPTKNGFELVIFEDVDGRKCTLQQSSLAHHTAPGTSAVRLGVEDHRMHLTRRQVVKLVSALLQWLDTDSFYQDGESIMLRKYFREPTNKEEK